MASPSPQNSPMPPPQAPSPMGPPAQSPAPPQSPHSPYSQQHVNGPPPSHPQGSGQPPIPNHMLSSGAAPHSMPPNSNGPPGMPLQHPGMPPGGHQMPPHMAGPHMPGPPGHPMGPAGSHPPGPNGHPGLPSGPAPQHPNMPGQGPPHGYMHQMAHMPPGQTPPGGGSGHMALHAAAPGPSASPVNPAVDDLNVLQRAIDFMEEKGLQEDPLYSQLLALRDHFTFTDTQHGQLRAQIVAYRILALNQLSQQCSAMAAGKRGDAPPPPQECDAPTPPGGGSGHMALHAAAPGVDELNALQRAIDSMEEKGLQEDPRYSQLLALRDHYTFTNTQLGQFKAQIVAYRILALNQLSQQCSAMAAGKRGDAPPPPQECDAPTPPGGGSGHMALHAAAPGVDELNALQRAIDSMEEKGLQEDPRYSQLLALRDHYTFTNTQLGQFKAQIVAYRMLARNMPISQQCSAMAAGKRGDAPPPPQECAAPPPAPYAAGSGPGAPPGSSSAAGKPPGAGGAGGAGSEARGGGGGGGAPPTPLPMTAQMAPPTQPTPPPLINPPLAGAGPQLRGPAPLRPAGPGGPPAQPTQQSSNMEEVLPGIATLPDEILLHIFKLLPVEDLLCCEEVSQRWNILARDPSIWRDIKFVYDRREQQQRVREMYLRLLETHSDVIQWISVCICMFCHEYKEIESILSALKNLTSITLLQCDFSDFSDVSLPYVWPQIKKLSFLKVKTGSLLQFDKFNALCSLELNLNGDFNLDLRSLIYCPNLKRLHIYYDDEEQSIDDEGLGLLSECLNLSELMISRCDRLTDKGLLLLASCRNLRVLYLICNRQFTEKALENFLRSSNIKQLRSLTLLGVLNVTPKMLVLISDLCKLDYLNLLWCPRLGLAFRTGWEEHIENLRKKIKDFYI